MGDNKLRNNPCWCGSGKKYKKCHQIREDQEAISRRELEAYSKSVRNKKVCSVSNLFPDECTSKIINAHTISKSGSLLEIAESGHVMGAKPSLSGLIKHEGKLVLEKVGVKKASTFTGFCSVHDKDLFIPLEDEPITLTQQQLFLLAYRGFCREYFNKESNKKTVDMMKEADRGKGIETQIHMQKHASLFDSGVDLALRDLRYLKSKLDPVLTGDNFSAINHCVIEFKSVPKLLVSSMIAPEMDFHGNRLQTLGIQDQVFEYIFFNCIAYDGKGAFIFSWLPEHNNYCNKFIDSLLALDENHISNALVRFCYSFSENTWSTPSWWDSQSKEAQNSIEARLLQGTPVALHPLDCLIDDGHEFNAFDIHRILRI
ncbi:MULTISPECIES: SEC-C domain-containing protein [Vibrio]|uniref:SEC-C domain-containing protein n=1 Tax=Vibrio atlanticus TaxID=693153 RepID=A0ABV4KV94_9VIBR|nr:MULTISPECIES: SEC-C domain-containing protein [Vibrio]